MFKQLFLCGGWIKPRYEHLSARWHRRSTKAATSDARLSVCIHWPIRAGHGGFRCRYQCHIWSYRCRGWGKHRLHKWGWARRGCPALQCREWLILVVISSFLSTSTTSHLMTVSASPRDRLSTGSTCTWSFAVAPCNWLSADRQGAKPSAECSLLSWTVPDVPWAWGTVSWPLTMGSARLSFNIDIMLSLTLVLCLTQWNSNLVCCLDIFSIEASMVALKSLPNWLTTLCSFSMPSAHSLTTCWHVSLTCNKGFN